MSTYRLEDEIKELHAENIDLIAQLDKAKGTIKNLVRVISILERIGSQVMNINDFQPEYNEARECLKELGDKNV